MTLHEGAEGKSWTAPVAAALLFAAWTLATWVLEGRIDTLLRPEAVADRAIYAVVANLLIGIALAIVVLWVFIRRGWLTRQAAGMGRHTPSVLRLVVAFGLGLVLYLLQGAPSSEPIILLNAFCQVLVVSAAEVVVCWALVAATVEALLKPQGRAVSIVGAALVASTLFGLHHFAHSAPFNTLGMVALLSAVGLLTSAFFFASSDVYATIIFHNFLGMFGVVQALAASGQLSTLADPQPPLLIMAVAAIGLLGIFDWMLLRRRTGSLPRLD